MVAQKTETTYFIAIYEKNGGITLCRTTRHSAMKAKIKEIASRGLTYSLIIKDNLTGGTI